MTAAVDARRWADEIGGDAYLPKPFTMAAVLATVERFCAPGRRRAAPVAAGARFADRHRPSLAGTPSAQEALAAVRALVHRLANELTLVTGYVELLAPHVASTARRCSPTWSRPARPRSSSSTGWRSCWGRSRATRTPSRRGRRALSGPGSGGATGSTRGARRAGTPDGRVQLCRVWS